MTQNLQGFLLWNFAFSFCISAKLYGLQKVPDVYMGQSIQERLSSTSFTRSILEYFVPYIIFWKFRHFSFSTEKCESVLIVDLFHFIKCHKIKWKVSLTSAWLREAGILVKSLIEKVFARRFDISGEFSVESLKHWQKSYLIF